MQLAKTLIKLQAELKELGALSARVTNRDIEVHLEKNIESLNVPLTVKSRDSFDFPYEVAAYIDGVKFFEVVEEEEFTQRFPHLVPVREG